MTAAIDGPILVVLACYVGLALLVGVMLLRSPLPAWVKTAVLLAVGALGPLAYEGLEGTRGWPAAASLPERFLYHYAVIVQPNRTTGDKGAIFLWATALEGDGTERAPRAYALPFDKSTYALLTEAQKRAKAGIVQMGATTDPTGRAGAAFVSRFTGASGEQKLRMSDLPEPSLPEK